MYLTTLEPDQSNTVYIIIGIGFFIILGVPGFMIFNLSVCFVTFEKFKEDKNDKEDNKEDKNDKEEDKWIIHIVSLVVMILYGLLFIFFFVFFIFVKTRKFTKIETLDYIDRKNTFNYTISPEYRMPFCSMKYGILDPIQLALLNTIHPFTNPFNSTVFNETLRYLKEEIQDFQIFNFDIDIMKFYITSDSQDMIVYTFGGLSNKGAYGIAFEAVIQRLLPNLLNNLIPFYSFLNNLFSDFFSTVIRLGEFLFCGSTDSSELVLIMENKSKNEDINITDKFYVGQTVGAFVLKELTLSLTTLKGISFDGNLASHSLLVQNKFFEEHHNPFNILNIYSGDSVLKGGMEKDFFNNVLLPSFFSMSHVPDVFETVCMTAALCSTDDRYFPYCQQVLSRDGEDGEQRYLEMLRKAEHR